MSMLTCPDDSGAPGTLIIVERTPASEGSAERAIRTLACGTV